MNPKEGVTYEEKHFGHNVENLAMATRLNNISAKAYHYPPETRTCLWCFGGVL